MRPSLLLALALLLPACTMPPNEKAQPASAPSQSAQSAQSGATESQPDATKPTPTPATVPTLRPEVVARFPHDRAAFTEGLQYLGNGQILESTGMVGESDLRIGNLETGKLTWQIPLSLSLPQAFGEGSTRLGQTIYQVTWQDGIALTYDAGTLKPTGQLRYEGEGWGLTNDGQSVIMSNGTPTVTWRDPKTFAVTRSIEVRDGAEAVKNLNELEYAAGALYANVWLTDRIARINPQTGAVTGWIDVSTLTEEVSTTLAKQGQTLTPDDVPNGIAYVPERGTFLLTGKRWPTIFEVKLK